MAAIVNDHELKTNLTCLKLNPNVDNSDYPLPISPLLLPYLCLNLLILVEICEI